MKVSKMISAIDTHTAGEAARLIIGGIPKFPGKTMADKRAYLENEQDHLRTMLMHEPRGHNEMFGAFICEPVHEEADYGIIFMDAGGYLNMCGHNTIAAMTTAVETGWVDVKPGDREVKVVQDTPAGIVTGMVHLDEDYSAESVSFENVESFLYKENVSVNVPDVGEIKVDISFGGSFFVLLPAEQFGLTIEPKNASKFSELGMKIRDAVNEQIEMQHPTLAHIKTADLVEFYGPGVSPEAKYRNVVVFGEGQVDRSPCGTGTSAKLATLYGKGEMGVGDTFVYESILGTKFKGEIVAEAEVEGFKGIIPRVTGSAYITGFNNFLIDPKDSLKDGFTLG
ncbi:MULTISPECIES: proline racemase family protein [Enterococcus]|uniref:Proline racemase family protein n=1 Tax=Enterococcus alishanensis TaxID=1303817 RepID=A0ABS6TC21_9ENTE|nr:proline racemase family protein [Enterococcus alishanensis]MBV7390447.1 proline racemase family protein [Enterococcus alishanensis]